MKGFSDYFEPKLKDEWKDFVMKYRSYEGFVEGLIISGLFDLFPQKESKRNDINIESKWGSNDYPHGPWNGVYLFYSEELKLLYVGKCTGKTTLLSKRISSYFKFDGTPEKGCQVKHDWKAPGPRYINAISLPERLTFELDSVESFLIEKLSPPENIRGVIK